MDLSTRADWERELERLLSPVLAHASPGCARIRLPGRASIWGAESDSLEAFARSLWGAGAWLSTNDDDPGLASFYRTGLLNGTNRSHEESWHSLLRVRQTLVEAAAIAWNVVRARRHLWEPLTDGERAQALAWLRAAGAIKPYDNNWHLFTVVVQTALKALGGEHDARRLDAALDRVDDLYVADGWYDDPHVRGARTLDYYNATVFHPYLLFWCRLDGASQPERAQRVVTRARTFLEHFAHWFAADGSFPCFGRSAVYRCAVMHAFVEGVASGVSPLPAGQVRRLCQLVAARSLGAPGVVGRDGLLTAGRAIAERYSGPGSAYWALKAFGALSLPEEHRFWTDGEEPLPIERDDYTLAGAGGHFLVHGRKRDGRVQVVNAGSLLSAKKYSNLVYASDYGYELDRERGLDEADPFGEASLCFSADGSVWFGRRRAAPLGVRDDTILLRSTYHCGGRLTRAHVSVYSAVELVDGAQLRVHRVAARRPVHAREGGFAFGGESPATGIRALRGYDVAPEPARGGGCNVLYADSMIPCVATAAPRRGIFYLASLVNGEPSIPEDRVSDLCAALDAVAQADR